MKGHSFKRAAGDQKGMTLMEVILIIIILGITVVPLTQVSMGNLKASARAARLTKAVFACQSILDQVIGYYENNGYAAARTRYAGGESGTCVPTGSSGLTYTIAMSAEATVATVTYCDVTVTVTGALVPSVVLKTRLAG
jgi:Tfp pilus assembly protein PilE